MFDYSWNFLSQYLPGLLLELFMFEEDIVAYWSLRLWLSFEDCFGVRVAFWRFPLFEFNVCRPVTVLPRYIGGVALAGTWN